MKFVWALLGSLLLSVGLTVTAVAQAPLATSAQPPTDASRAPGGTSTSVAAEAEPALTTATPFRSYWELGSVQPVLPRPILLVREGHGKSRGTRSDKQFFEISRTGGNNVPEAALRAYKNAEKAMAVADPGCHVSWTMLAAIGRVESDHGRFGGAQLGSDGVSRPEIRGPRLDGAGAFAAIADSDHGTLDRDRVWDRAVGQMQFLPSTWREVARDGDGDGKRNPDDIDDSALGSAVYLCGAGGSLADAAGMSRAAFRYNHSDYYVALVLSFQAGYATGVFSLPSPPPPETPVVRRTSTRTIPARKPTRAATSHPSTTHPATQAAPKPRPRTSPTPPTRPTPAPAPKPAPKPTPKPAPKPTQTGPVLVTVSGTWASCGGGYCLGSTPLDLGGGGVGAARANGDLDGNGSVGSNAEELAGLVGKQVTLRVERRPANLVVYVVGTHAFRNADGSPARMFAAPATTAASAP
jgi:membrane-bound lytic murein transglycosylase B